MQKAAEEVEKLAEVDKTSTRLVIQPKTGYITQLILSATPELFAFLVLSFVFLYFLLFSGESIADSFIRNILDTPNQQTTADIGHFIKQEISRYLLTITLINGCLGIIVTLTLALIGLPNALLWGTMTALLNFAPYIGAICSAFIIATVSFVTFDSIAYALLAPAAFLVLTTLEGQFITPQILGNRFAINPLLVFLSIILWGWIWGFVGALLAVPLLVSIKIICQSMSGLRPFADFLGKSGQDRTAGGIDKD